MAQEVAVSIEGIDELNETLDKVIKSVGPDVVEPLFMEGAKTIQAAVKAAAPKGPTGNLKKGIKVKHLEKIGNNPRSAMVKSTAPHDHLVEFGTKPRRTKKGKYTGAMSANPFFRPAVDATLPGVINQITNQLKQKIDQAVQ